jgi:hypothetical protein
MAALFRQLGDGTEPEPTSGPDERLRGISFELIS